MNSKKDSSKFGPNCGVEIVVVDDSNSVFNETRQPARDFVRKAVRERLEREKKLLELKEEMYGKPANGQSGKQSANDVTRIE